MTFNTVQEARVWASSFLEQHDREPRVGELLLRYLLGVSHSQWLAMGRDSLDQGLADTFVAWIHEHAETGKPIEHFTKEVDFFDDTFYVDERVLIPRPETEELVLAVLNELDDGEMVVDVGTGSGVIALSLKGRLKDATVIGTDLSEDALAVARSNGEQLERDVLWKSGDFLRPVLDEGITPDVIVSNPPYIPHAERDSLSETVSLHDPAEALFAEKNGLASYDTIMKQVMQFDTRPKLIAFEIGYDQGESVPDLIQSYDPAANVRVLQDINGKDRIVLWN
ncbi:peptide chain release factor N(5)-glutamine methyltransferase [Alkalibacillus salilacus]|uniref:peptide chain release factor N(5)-glutamine methyltransferase n=1 Tax=Alkalibacillus salilacus TaxID=284582 RepID=A0ABT9VI04_9BACI|nr:peptide chain release factor N(5)-glutamine methyltransferase [Alkalibacillus salilacus]MDQ0160589.1 release factor glutamine methyltransferase [Alkalibacillus salilacus]